MCATLYVVVTTADRELEGMAETRFDYLCFSCLQVSGECLLTVIDISTRAHANVTALEAVELTVRVLAEDVFIRTLPFFVHHLRQLQQTHNSLFVSLAN